eukprot:XP_025003554.1 uncharacterized protein LOC107052673 [Gallus gallus]
MFCALKGKNCLGNQSQTQRREVMATHFVTNLHLISGVLSEIFKYMDFTGQNRGEWQRGTAENKQDWHCSLLRDLRLGLRITGHILSVCPVLTTIMYFLPVRCDYIS